MHDVDVKHSQVIPFFFLSFAFSNWLSNASALITRHIVGFYLAYNVVSNYVLQTEGG